jgi:chloramphenicol-sensitive protein RarD
LATPPDPAVTSAQAARSDAQAGLVVALLCYVLWGFLPVLLHLVRDAGAVMVVAHRTVWSLLFVGAILVAGRRFHEVRAALRDKATLRSMLISAAVLAFNWLAYVYAVESDQLLQASLGYFINPLMNVVIGMLLLGERQTGWQWVAIGTATLAIVIQTLALGTVPYIALAIATSFALYGYFRKTAKVGSASGLFVETLLLTPLALGYIGFTLLRDGAGVHADPGLMALLVLMGPATAVPLLLFAFAVQRLRLTTIGMLQYLSPTMQFLLAVYAFHEGINGLQLVSFGLIWLSLAIYSADSLLRRGRAPA